MPPQIAAPREDGAIDHIPLVCRYDKRRVPAPRALRARAAAALLAAFAVFPGGAHAYIDPNTGGYVFQALFPVVSVILGWYVFFRENMKKVLGGLASRIRKLLG